jgi:1,4-dihydroxy-2-naphthoyl-CoA hydrolase
MIWFQNYSLEQVNSKNKKTMVEHCGINITKITESSLEGSMPVAERTRQPSGILHGGANCVLAETLGSIAANMTCDPDRFHAVGLSITTNHVKAIRNGEVRAVAKANHIGRTTQVWDIKTYNSSEQLTSITSLTMAVVSKLGK